MKASVWQFSLALHLRREYAAIVEWQLWIENRFAELMPEMSVNVQFKTLDVITLYLQKCVQKQAQTHATNK